MVTIKKKKLRGNEYYYLVHNYRVDGKTKRLEKYLGTKIPDNIDEIKAEFFREVYHEIWFTKLDLVQKNFFEMAKNLPKSIVKKNFSNFAVQFTYNSNRIEGNTLRLNDTKLLLKDGISPSNKPIDDIKEIESHQKVFYDMVEYEGEISEKIILTWHYDLLKDTKYDIAGFYRKYDVGIEGSDYTPPMGIEVEIMIHDFYDWLNRSKFNLHPVELAALVHQKFVSIHPFGDGNGRISRLIMNFILNRFNFPMIIIDYKKRSSYYNALKRSQLNDDPYIFVKYIFRVFLKMYDKFADIIAKVDLS
ncbi:MAG: Fic family protein [Candidatus Heimdallarchaeota archaeon]|nr:Fic family protein [Candidatus Heimdallarchaeota archaeon]